MLTDSSDRLIAKLARYAAAADNGALGAVFDGTMPATESFHKGSAKAYRHAIALVIANQRETNSIACNFEQ